MKAPQVVRLLKQDEFGRVELLDGALGLVVRRVACGSRLPLSRSIARVLMRRERAALERLDAIDGVAHLVRASDYARAPSPGAGAPRVEDVLLRSYLAGSPLHEADALPRDFFDRLDELIHELHGVGVCHNDLHKEQNVLVDERGYPGLVDFQLASVHARTGRTFTRRAAEDLRHAQKHRRRYTRDGRGPEEAARGAGHGLRRGPLARLWRKAGKPVYNALFHGLFRKRATEGRRESSGPWPRWTEPLGTRGRGPTRNGS